MRYNALYQKLCESLHYCCPWALHQVYGVVGGQKKLAEALGVAYSTVRCNHRKYRTCPQFEGCRKDEVIVWLKANIDRRTHATFSQESKHHEQSNHNS